MKYLNESAARLGLEVSQKLRDPRKGAGGVDTRRETTAWAMLVWAYRAECVRAAATGGSSYGFEMAGRWSATAAACAMAEGMLMGGRSGYELHCHADALAVHGWVEALQRADYWMVVQAAEAGEPPAWQVDFPPLKVEPVMRQTSAGLRPRIIYGRGGRDPLLCPVAYVGVSSDEIEAARARARERYVDFVTLCAEIKNAALSGAIPLASWRPTRIGLPWAPWNDAKAA